MMQQEEALRSQYVTGLIAGRYLDVAPYSKTEPKTSDSGCTPCCEPKKGSPKKKKSKIEALAGWSMPPL